MRSVLRSLVFVPLIPFVGAFGVADAATTINVPADRPTIQEAVDAAANGDTIRVSHGSYPENVLVNAKNDLTIRGIGKVRIHPAAGPAIHIQSASGVTLTGLAIENVSGVGVLFDQSVLCNLRKCKIDTVSGDGVRTVDCEQLHIEKNTILDAGNNGIGLDSGNASVTDGSFIVKNKIVHPFKTAVVVNGSNNEITGNKASHCGTNGFEIDAATMSSPHDNVFEGNTVKVATQFGLVVNGENHSFTQNKVSKTGDDGIQLLAGVTLCEVSDNKVTKAGNDGIFVAVAAVDNGLRTNKITKSAGDGIDLGGASSTLDGNKIKKAGDNGFEIDGTNNQIKNNKAVKSGAFDAIDTTGGSTNTYSNNTFTTTSGLP